MMSNSFLKLTLLCLFLLLIETWANINSDLNNFFNNMGFSSNVTAPNAYKGQEAGYYSGGSIFSRNAVRDAQLVSIDLPSYRSGCGGIDLFSGGFSFINSQELVNVMQNVINNAKGYAFNLALESATPEIAGVMKYMNTLANSVNNMNINSCETAAGLVGSIWPKTHVAQQQVCQDIGAGKGVFTDWAAARQGCATGGNMTSVLNGAKGNPEYESMLLNGGNIAWKAIQRNGLLSGDKQLAELMMALSGTMIVSSASNDKSKNQFRVLSSLATDEQLLNSLLHGGSAKVYVCDTKTEDGCLNPSIGTVTISANSGLQTQVAKLLDSMTTKILSDQPLNVTEIGLLQATRLPIYKMLNVQSAFAGNSSIMDLTGYADIIATDILFQYLSENLNFMRASVASLQYPENMMQQFMQGITEARSNVRSAQQNAYSQIAIATQLIEQTQMIEQMLAGQLSSQLTNTLKWADNLRQ